MVEVAQLKREDLKAFMDSLNNGARDLTL